MFQPMMRARDSPQCAICEFVMKEVEDMLEDQTTEVGWSYLMDLKSICHIVSNNKTSSQMAVPGSKSDQIGRPQPNVYLFGGHGIKD